MTKACRHPAIGVLRAQQRDVEVQAQVSLAARQVGTHIARDAARDALDAARAETGLDRQPEIAGGQLQRRADGQQFEIETVASATAGEIAAADTGRRVRAVGVQHRRPTPSCIRALQQSAEMRVSGVHIATQDVSTLRRRSQSEQRASSRLVHGGVDCARQTLDQWTRIHEVHGQLIHSRQERAIGGIGTRRAIRTDDLALALEQTVVMPGLEVRLPPGVALYAQHTHSNVGSLAPSLGGTARASIRRDRTEPRAQYEVQDALIGAIAVSERDLFREDVDPLDRLRRQVTHFSEARDPYAVEQHDRPTAAAATAAAELRSERGDEFGHGTHTEGADLLRGQRDLRRDVADHGTRGPASADHHFLELTLRHHGRDTDPRLRLRERGLAAEREQHHSQQGLTG